MKNNTFEEIWEKIDSSKNILMSLHYGPDGDSLACCVAMKYLLEKRGKNVTLIGKDELDSNLSKLDYAKEVEFGKDVSMFDWNNFDIVLAMDSGAKKQFMPEDFEIPELSKLIVIDHHDANNYFGGLNYVETLSSCCGVLLKMLRHLNLEIDSELATRLLLGIYTDTGYFSHDNGESLKEAAFLVDKGANYKEEIVNKIRYNVPLRIKKYYALAVNNFKEEKIGEYNIGYSSTRKDEIEAMGLNLSEARGAVNYLQEIGGVDIIFTLTDMNDFIKGSFRSRKNIDVNLIAKELGGGGHKQAAAFKLKKMSLEEAEKKVLEAIERVGVHTF